MKKATFTSSLVLGHAVVLTTVSAVAIYGLDYYEKMYGKGISFQISLWFVVLGAIVTGIGFGLGVAISNWIKKYWIGLLVGGLFAGVIVGLSILSSQVTQNTGTRQFVLFASWFLGSFIIPIAMSKLTGAKSG